MRLEQIEEGLDAREGALANVLLGVDAEGRNRREHATGNLAGFVIRRRGGERHQTRGSRGGERIAERAGEGVEEHAFRRRLGEVARDVSEKNRRVGANGGLLVNLQLGEVLEQALVLALG